MLSPGKIEGQVWNAKTKREGVLTRANRIAQHVRMENKPETCVVHDGPTSFVGLSCRKLPMKSVYFGLVSEEILCLNGWSQGRASEMSWWVWEGTVDSTQSAKRESVRSFKLCDNEWSVVCAGGKKLQRMCGKTRQEQRSRHDETATRRRRRAPGA